ncbi:MAG: helix-turn-helix domain-containing protein [Spirochaetes bacterium]|nr:helix-turn-helix domain-containing protein [Spirochaetota bacterium]
MKGCGFLKKIALISALSAACVAIPDSTVLETMPAFVIDNYSSILNFSNIPAVRIQRGDNPDYAQVEYDDSAWKTISLPSDWTKYFPSWVGVCWYRFRVKFPPSLPSHSVGIQLGVISDVDELYFNGVKIAATGSFPPNRQSCYDKIRIYEIPTVLIRPGIENIFALRVAGLFLSGSGPYTGEFYIGPFMKLQRNLLAKEFFTMFFVVIYLAVGIYFGIIFVLHVSEKENLFFSLTTLSSAIYFFFRTQVKYLVSDNFLLMKKLEYMVLFLIFSLFLEFITYYAFRRRTVVHYIYHIVTAMCIGMVAASNDPLVWNAILKNIVQPSWIFPVAFCFYVIIDGLKIYKEFYFILISFIILSITLVNDILVNRHVYEFLSLSPYAYLILIMGISYIMHRRFIELKRKVNEKSFDKGTEFGRKRLRIGVDAEEKLKKALAIIEEKYSQEVTREMLADELGMNADYFGKLFKQYTGKKISEYVNEIRVRNAQKLLSDPENSISSIAFAVGFESLPTFYRVFQKCTGESPQSYRRKILQISQ